MYQYIGNETFKVKMANGEGITVTHWRSRDTKNDSELGIAKVEMSEDVRVDLLLYRLNRGLMDVTNIIDNNEVDIFSLSVGDTVKVGE